MGFTRIHASFVLALCMSLWGTALILVATFTDHWFETTTTESALRVGLTSKCDNSLCLPYNWSQDLDFGTCKQTASQFDFRFSVVRYTLWGACGVSGLSNLFTILAVSIRASKILYLGQFLLTLAFCAACLACTLFYISMEKWMFCDLPYCDWYSRAIGSGRPCFHWYGFSFTIAAGGVVLYLLSTVWCGFTLVAAATVEQEEEEEEEVKAEVGHVVQPHQGTAAGVGNAESQANDETALLEPVSAEEGQGNGHRERSVAADQHQENEPAQVEGEEEGYGIPEGYVYDEESGYHYCAETDWYYDASTGRYYNPRTQEWVG